MKSIFKKEISSLLWGNDPDAVWFRWRPWRGPLVMAPAKKLERLVALNDRLAGLAECNMPFAEGLAAFAEDAVGPRLFRVHAAQMKRLLDVLRKDLLAGYALSEAMARRPRFFPRFYCHLVRVGEEGGRLAETLRELTPQLLHRLEMQLRLQTYASYLVLTSVAPVGILAFLWKKVVPVLQEITQDTVADALLTTPSSVVEPFSAAPAWIGVALVAVLGGVIALLALALPSFRFMRRRRTLGWLAFSLERLLEGGVPLDEALALAGGQGLLGPSRRLARRLQARVVQGHSFTEALRAEGGAIPAGMTAMASIGESTGRLPQALGRVGDLYLAQSQRHARVLLDVLSPLALVAVGGVVLAAAAYLVTTYANLTQLLEL